MNKFYMIGGLITGVAALLFYHAGRQDMANELKAKEAKKWEDAIDLTETDPERVSG